MPIALSHKRLHYMAESMTAVGKQKYQEGNRHFVNWSVSVDDLLQWIGVWMYMLAFPMEGDRRAYWASPMGGYGPSHRLMDYLALGQNGEKGVRWFEMMMACFELPVLPNTDTPDRFRFVQLADSGMLFATPSMQPWYAHGSCCWMSQWCVGKVPACPV